MKRKIYAPVTEFERATSYCPLYLAWRILDRQIDALVYDLYQPASRLRPAGALTPAEIKIVESASAEAPARQGSAVL
jgi:hypothetical protein